MGDYDLNFGGDEVDGDEDNEEGWQWGGRNATVFLIDVAPKMFEPIQASGAEDGDPLEMPFVAALKCVHANVCRQVISSDQDLTAVVLFNTVNSTGKSAPGSSSVTTLASFPHVAVMQPLDRPSADRVIALEALMKDGLKGITAEYGGVGEDSSISDALWACNNIITQCKHRMAGQHVLLFTCLDAPHAPGSHLAAQALCKARDFDNADIDLELVSMGQGFKSERFYTEILTLGGEAPERAPLVSSGLRLQQLQERVRRLQHKQRTTGRVAFTLAPGLQMSVGLYTGLRKTSKPSKQKLYRTGNEEVRSVTKQYLEETGELLMPSDFAKYTTVASKKIKFTVEETREMNKVFSPGIELLGFKPASAIKAYQYVKPASFLYPDDENIKGSSSVFAALLQRCVARAVVPVVRVVPRANSAPSWAALLPQEEQLDEDGYQIKSPGFHVCYLPFADDFRLVTVEGRERASAEQVDLAAAVVKKLHFRYDPCCFENPDLQTHWRNIEALALNRHSLEPVTDYTVPDYARIRKKTEHLVSSLKDAVWPNGYDPVAAARRKAPPKPRAPAGSASTSRGGGGGEANVEQLAKDNKVQQLTVPVLKVWLEGRGQRTTGKKKAELVQDVYDLLA